MGSRDVNEKKSDSLTMKSNDDQSYVNNKDVFTFIEVLFFYIIYNCQFLMAVLTTTTHRKCVACKRKINLEKRRESGWQIIIRERMIFDN